MLVTKSVNPFIAERLREVADLLEQQQANRLRVRARQAADTVASCGEDLRELNERQSAYAGGSVLPDRGAN